MMNITDRATAMRALAACDQMDSYLADGNQEAIKNMQEVAKKFVNNMEVADIRAALKCVRARANEVLTNGEY